jgi:hypothetical protein
VLLEHGRFVPGQYVITLVNCCQKYGDVRGTIADTRSGLNVGDFFGTRYMDLITNVGFPFFLHGRLAALALVSGLLNHEAPSSYDQILGDGQIGRWLLTGEEDNAYQPPVIPGGATSPVPWGGLDEQGVVARSEEKRFQTETLGVGSYTISMTGSVDRSTAAGPP